METIKHNEFVLKTKIEQLSHIVIGGTNNYDKTHVTDIYNQLAQLFTMILNVLQDIENSLTFCKLHVLHPSIIKVNDLHDELT